MRNADQFAAPVASSLLNLGFVALAIILAAGTVWLVLRASGDHEAAAVRRRWAGWTAMGAAAWLLLTWLVAASGAIARVDRRPPPMMFMFLAVLTLSTALAFSGFGTRLLKGLPLWLLVATQSFRLPLELLMHQAADEGVMPEQMTYTGWNFDIITGATAVVVALLLARGRAGRRLALGWNVLGTVLLVNILTIAMISTPMVGAFGSDRQNTWVAYPPFVWLPTVMVVAAITGHLLVFRKLRSP